MIHVEIVPFVLMRVNVCDYLLVCALPYFEGILRMKV